jgi:hypothetical protein
MYRILYNYPRQSYGYPNTFTRSAYVPVSSLQASEQARRSSAAEIRCNDLDEQGILIAAAH